MHRRKFTPPVGTLAFCEVCRRFTPDARERVNAVLAMNFGCCDPCAARVGFLVEVK